MAAKGYTDKATIQTLGIVTIDAAIDSQLDGWIEAVENIIDAETGRNFKADTVATARLFDGDNSEYLLIDDAVEITTVEIGADSYGGTFTTVPSSGASRYFTDPANHTALKVPVTKLTLNAGRFLAGKQNQRITAKWGYSVVVPQAIKLAATTFVLGIINHNRQGGSEIKSERIGNYQVTYNSDAGGNSWADFEQAMATLQSYKRYFL